MLFATFFLSCDGELCRNSEFCRLCVCVCVGGRREESRAVSFPSVGDTLGNMSIMTTVFLRVHPSVRR